MRAIPSQFSERELEDYIFKSLVDTGYIKGESSNFDKQFAIDKEQFWGFLEDTQQEELDKVIRFHPADWKVFILQQLDRKIKRNGVLSILKKGLQVYDASFQFLYPLHDPHKPYNNKLQNQ